MARNVDYIEKAKEDAADTVRHFKDEIIQNLKESGIASTDLGNDYDGGDGYHHESHVDKYYSLLEAAEALDQLSDYEETDSGLWEGVEDPRKAVATQAAFTYGNAVYHFWEELMGEINLNADSIVETPQLPEDWDPRKKKISDKFTPAQRLETIIKAWL